MSQLARNENHPSQLLQLAATYDPNVAPAAALRLKNLLRVSRVSPSQLTVSSREGLRTHILQALSVASLSPVQSALAECVRWLILLDFPAHWHNLFPDLNAFLSSGDASRVYAALVVLRQLTKCYEYKSRDPSKLHPTDDNDCGLSYPRQPLESLAAAFFPSLLELYCHLDALIAKPSDASKSTERDHACNAQRLIVKVFWSATHVILPPCLSEGDTIDRWLNTFLTTLRRPCAHVHVESDDELSQVPEWKTKKWIAQVFNRFLRRYGSPKKIPVDEPWALPIANAFKTRICEPATVVILDVLCLGSNGHQLSHRVAQICLDFIEEAIETAQLWSIIFPRVDTLLTRVIFSYLCFSEADEELWTTDPGEFVRKQYDFSEDLTSPRIAASSLLAKMGELRSKRTVLPFLHYLMQSVFDPYSKSIRGSSERAALAYQKVGAFASLAAVKCKLISKPDLGASLIGVLKVHVEPDLQSEFGFLRSASAWLMGQIASVPWDMFSRELGENVLRGCVALLEDHEIPVQASAAGALQHLLEQEGSASLIESAAPQLLDRLLQLMDRMSDSYGSLLPAIDKLVERYPEKIMPLAMPLVQRLMMAFRQAAEGILKDSDEEDDDLVFTAAQVLHLLSSVIAAIGEWRTVELDRKKGVLDKVEIELEPLLSVMFEESHQVFVEELLDVLGTLIVQNGEVNGRLSNLLLSLVPKMTKSVEIWASDYMEQMMDPIEGYFTFGLESLCKMENGLSCFVHMVNRLWSDKFQDVEAVYGAKIAEMIVLNLHKVDSIQELCESEIVVRIGRGAAERLVKSSVDEDGTQEWLFTVLMECCYVNAVKVLEALGSQPVLQLIGAHTAVPHKLVRQYSKKGVMLGLCTILCTKGLVREDSKVFMVRLILQLLHLIESQRDTGTSSDVVLSNCNGGVETGTGGVGWRSAVKEGKAELIRDWDINSLKATNGFSTIRGSSRDDAASDLEDDEDALNTFEDTSSERSPDDFLRLSGSTGLSVETLQQLNAANGGMFHGDNVFSVGMDDDDDDDDDEVIGLGGHALDQVDELAYIVRCVRSASRDPWWSSVSSHDRAALEELGRRVEARKNST